MTKQLTSFVVICLFVFSASCQSNLCPVNYIWNDGCVKLCSHPDFSNCPDVFTLEYNPRFCALFRNGAWRSYTHACQACQNSDVVGIKDGRCSCEIQGCSQGQVCNNGKCEPRPPTSPIIPAPCYCPNGSCVYGRCIPHTNCSLVLCAQGFQCMGGRCIPNQGYCNSEQDCQQFQFCSGNKCIDRCSMMLCQRGYKCIRGRCILDSSQCKYDYQCPNSHVCNRSGVCVDKCTLIKCYSGQMCIDGVCVSECKNVKCQLGYSCKQGKCQPINGFCTNNLYCKYGQICNQNRCTNFCSIALCPVGTICQGTRCVKQNQCVLHQQCGAGKKCLNHQCVDACIDIICPYNYQCKQGRCIPPTGFCRYDYDCAHGYVCNMGKCLTKCALIRCSPGYVCINGQCIANKGCQSQRDCPLDLTCVNRTCLPDCSHTVCPQNHACRYGICYPYTPCSLIECPQGSICKQGLCIAQAGYCTNDSMCKSHQFCYNKKCQDRCMYIRCAYGFICKQGKCIDICTNVTCETGFQCSQGICVRNTSMCRTDYSCKNDQFCQHGICVNKCDKVECPVGSSCLNGVCELDLTVCKAEYPFMAKSCRNPRPTNQTCPIIYYFVQPQPQFCGVKSDGTRVSYVRQCQVCKDTQVQYYFDQPCHQSPFVCQKNQICYGYYCGGNKCSKSDECPYDWQTCSNGQCLDICTFLKCHTCFYGQCGYVQPYGDCRIDTDCDRTQWSCVGWKCVDLCKNTRCKANQRCRRGVCYDY